MVFNHFEVWEGDFWKESSSWKMTPYIWIPLIFLQVHSSIWKKSRSYKEMVFQIQFLWFNFLLKYEGYFLVFEIKGVCNCVLVDVLPIVLTFTGHCIFNPCFHSTICWHFMSHNAVSPWHAIITGCQVVADTGTALSALLFTINGILLN